MIVKTYIKPKLGRIGVKELTSQDIQEAYDAMITEGLSARTVQYAHSILRSAMNEAVKDRVIIANPCRKARIPRLQSREGQSLSREQARRFLDTAKGDKYYELFYLAIETGLRPGEYLGLRWKDIDFENSCLSVQRAVAWSRRGGFDFVEPKTKRSRRKVALSKSLVRALKTHQRRQRANGDLLDPNGLDLVFVSDAGTPVQTRNLRDRHFLPILQKAGLERVRLYDLRHTMASLMLSNNENPKVVSERLGHSSILLTMDTYSHVLPTIQVEAAERLATLLRGRKRTKPREVDNQDLRP